MLTGVGGFCLDFFFNDSIALQLLNIILLYAST